MRSLIEQEPLSGEELSQLVVKGCCLGTADSDAEGREGEGMGGVRWKVPY